MKAGWAAIALAFVMAIIGIVLDGRRHLARRSGRLALLSDRGRRDAFLGLVPVRGRLLGGWIYVGLFILSAIWGFAESRGTPGRWCLGLSLRW